MSVSFFAIAVDEVAIHPKENFCGSKSHPLVAIDKRVVHRQAFKEGSRFRDDVVVVPYCGRMIADSSAPASRSPA